MEHVDVSTVKATLAKVVADPFYVLELAKGAAVAYIANMRDIYEESPFHVVFEVVLIVFILYVLLFKSSYDPKKRGFGDRAPEGLTEREKRELIDEWEPQPLLPAVQEKDRAYEGSERVVHSSHGTRVDLECHDGQIRTLVNFASFDFLGLGSSDIVRSVALDTMEKYTLGSCGPRGFYGTFDKHIELEDALAKFFGVPEAITYSDLNSTISSTIPAFAKRGDLLVIDEHANDAIFTGAQLSRARVRTFKHNDMADLERILGAVHDDDRKHGRDGTQQRRFIIVEGLYRNTGNITPLSAVVALKERFCFRLIVDESSSFGALGASGRGAVEHAGLTLADVEVVVGPLNTVLGSVGGFCVGSREVVDHQRLSGAGYCFSASAPPFTAAVAHAALAEMQSRTEILETLHATARAARKAIAPVAGLRVLNNADANADSPIIHVALTGSFALDDEVDASRRLQRIADEAVKHGIAVVPSKYIATAARPSLPEPTIRIVVSAAHSAHDIKLLGSALAKAAAAVAAASGVDLASETEDTQHGDDEDEAEPGVEEGSSGARPMVYSPPITRSGRKTNARRARREQ